MRLTLTQTVHKLFGSPPVTKPEATHPITAPYGCRVCGGTCDRGLEWEEWGGSKTSVPDRVRSSSSWVVCEACVAICARFSPCPARPAAEGKEDIRWGNLSVMYDDRGIVTATKGEKSVIREWLASAKQGAWFAVVAESGQKHVLPWGRWNPAGKQHGRVRFEERDMLVTDETLRLVAEMTALLTAGASKETIETGLYSVNQWRLIPREINAFEDEWRHERGGDSFALALWLAQRDEEETALRIERESAARAAKKAAEKEREKHERSRAKPPKSKPEKPQGDRPRAKRSAAPIAGGVDPGASQRVPCVRGKRNDSLGPADVSAECVGAIVRDDGPVDQQGPAPPAADVAVARQLTLFGGPGD